MKHDDEVTVELPETVPVFPLPNTVLFPRTVLPLHIFEPRYREMTERALEGDGYIAMALRRVGGEEAGYHDVGCLGRISQSRRTEDGRYYVHLVGLQKVAFGDLVTDENSWLTAHIAPIDEEIPDDTEPGSHDDLVKLLGVCTVLFQEVSDRSFPMVSIKEGLPYEAVVNSICFHIGLPVEVKQSLLEEDDLRDRCRRLTEFVNTYLQKIVLSRDADPEDDEDQELVN